MASQDNINVFEPDLLDVAVTSYEENVPLIAQIAAGFTPPGVAADVAAATKYGRDAVRDFTQGRVGQGGANLGIAALSGLGAIPLIGDLARGPKSVLKQMVKAKTQPGGIANLDDDMVDLKRILSDDVLTDQQKIAQITDHPAILKAENVMRGIEDTTKIPGFGSENFVKNRMFNVPGKKVVGYDEAVTELYKGGRTLAYREMDKPIPTNVMAKNTGPKIANVVIGPPPAGKSAISNPLAIKFNATVIDPDEAKFILPEFKKGIGGNAVHKESKILSNLVKDVAIKKGDNLVIPTIGGDPNKIKNIIGDLQVDGYKVNLVLTDIDPDLALVRMNDRFLRKGRLINQDAANAYKGKSNTTYDLLKQEGIADGYAKIDTTTRVGEPKKIYEDTAKIFEDTNL